MNLTSIQTQEPKAFPTIPEQETPDAAFMRAYNYYVPESHQTGIAWIPSLCFPSVEIEHVLDNRIEVSYNELQGNKCSYPSSASTPSTVDLSLGDAIDALSVLYGIDDFPALRDFLHGKMHLVSVLVSAYFQIDKFFDDKVQRKTLSVIDDPEEDYRGILVKIYHSTFIEEAQEMLDAFDDKWWLDLDPSIRNLIIIDIAL